MPKSKTSLNQLLYDIRRIAEHREVLTEKKINAIYNTLRKDLRSFLSESYEEYADADGRLYLSYLDSQRKRAWFLNEIVKNVDNIEPLLQKEVSTLINTVYEKCYSGMADAINKADTRAKLEKISKDISVQPDVLKQAVNNNISKLTLPQVMEKHRSEIIYQIQQELSVGLMNGDRYETMAKRISERVGVSESKAKNITRTETHRNIESGFMDCGEYIQDKIEDSELIYAVTWRTMKDNRVRPQTRRKTKKGWKSGYNKNGANHIQMEGQTVKVGEMFDLGGGVKAKAPSKSGVAAHDCNCRCYLEYNLMTVEEFAKATGQKLEKVIKNNNTNKENGNKENGDNIKIKLSDFPQEFTKGAEGKNTQKLVDFINNIEGADPNVLKLYSNMGKLDNISSNGITFKISHAKNHQVITSYHPKTKQISEVKIAIPKLSGDNYAGQVNTTLHEQAHLMDLFGREDIHKESRWFSVQDRNVVDTVRNTSSSISDEISDLFKQHNTEYEKIRKNVKKSYEITIKEVKEKYLPNGMSPWENISGYRAYEKEAKKLYKEMAEDIEYQSRNIMGGGICNLQDIYDALSDGTYRANGTVMYGHGQQYYALEDNKIAEIVANYLSLSVTRPDLIKMLRKDKPQLCEVLDKMVLNLLEKAGG